jgi:hypothetical protein
MNKNYLILGSVALVGAGAYFVYKKSKENEDVNKTAEDILAKQKEAQEENALRIIAEQKHQSSIDLQNKNSFNAKVYKVQLYLGVKPDTIIGANTIKALATKFGGKFDTINTGNIDAILTEINSRNKSASDLAQKNTANSVQAGLIKYAKDFVASANNLSNYAELMKDHSAPLYAYDTFKRKFVPMGKSQKFYKGNKFGKRAGLEFVVKGDDGYVFVQTYNGSLYMFDPKYFTVKSN